MTVPTPHWQPTPSGIEFSDLNGSPIPEFPVAPGSPVAAQSSVRLLEELWGRNLVERSASEVVLPWLAVYELDEQERNILGIPEPDERVRGTLKSELWLSAPAFRIWIEIETLEQAEPRRLRAGDRRGLLIDTPEGGILPPKAIGQLVLLLDQPLPDTPAERTLLVAEAKRLAARSGRVALDDFLSREEYIVPDGIGVDVEVTSPEEIQLHPTTQGVDQRDFRGFSDGPVKSVYTQFMDAGLRRRLVLRRDQRDAIGDLRAHGALRGRDVPRFFDNPEAFLPDAIDIDLAEFSKRVRGLVPVRYRSQPYISVERTKRRGWFEASPHVEVTGGDADDGDLHRSGASGAQPQQSDQLSPDEFRELAEHAAANGERYVRYRDGWMEIDPEQAGRFLEFCDDHPEAGDDGRRLIDRDGAQLVLDVIPNTDVLEYVESYSDSKPLSNLPHYDAPRSLRAELYPHQETGYNWMRYLHENGWGGLLADDMGLGKTVQVISFMSFLHDTGALKPALLVVPVSVIVNWKNELRRFAPGIQPAHEHRGSGRERSPKRLAEHEVVITTYATLRRDQLMLGKVDWTVVACDEAQNVKNPTANVTSAIKGMKASFRIACTGTPVENGLSELWCIVDFAQPGRLGSRTEFRDDFERPLVDALADTGDQEGHVARLRARLKPHYMRRIKEEALSLPPKTVRTYNVPMSERQGAAYAQILNRLRHSDTNPLAALQHLIAACSHPSIADGSGDLRNPGRLLTDSPKLVKTMEILDKIRELDEKVVIYTRLKAMQRIIQSTINARFGFNPSVLNGEVSGPNRHHIVEAFNRGRGFDVMILSPEAAGVGLNITGATHVIHYTRLWNPAKENQATDRVHRIGQSRPVTVHYPVVVGDGFKSVEEHLNDLLQEKLQLARNVLVPRKSLDFVNELERRVQGQRPFR